MMMRMFEDVFEAKALAEVIRKTCPNMTDEQCEKSGWDCHECHARAVMRAGWRRQKTATWVVYNDGSGVCSNCGRTSLSVADQDNWQRYCGHCGALMTDLKTNHDEG